MQGHSEPTLHSGHTSGATPPIRAARLLLCFFPLPLSSFLLFLCVCVCCAWLPLGETHRPFGFSLQPSAPLPHRQGTTHKAQRTGGEERKGGRTEEEGELTLARRLARWDALVGADVGPTVAGFASTPVRSLLAASLTLPCLFLGTVALPSCIVRSVSPLSLLCLPALLSSPLASSSALCSC
jgi:hypothetical protein